MGIMNRIVAMTISRMSKEDKERLIEDMIKKFLADMTVEDKQKIANSIIDRFFSDMTTEDKQKIIREIMPQMMEGFNTTVIMPQMLMAMMGLGQQQEGMSGVMPMMVNVTGKPEESKKADTKIPDDSMPGESCPNSKLCENNVQKPKRGKK